MYYLHLAQFARITFSSGFLKDIQLNVFSLRTPIILRSICLLYTLFHIVLLQMSILNWHMYVFVLFTFMEPKRQ